VAGTSSIRTTVASSSTASVRPRASRGGENFGADRGRGHVGAGDERGELVAGGILLIVVLPGLIRLAGYDIEPGAFEARHHLTADTETGEDDDQPNEADERRSAGRDPTQIR